MPSLKSEVWRAVFCPQLSNAALSQGSRFNDFSTACFVKAYWTVGPVARVSANAIAVGIRFSSVAKGSIKPAC